MLGLGFMGFKRGMNLGIKVWGLGSMGFKGVLGIESYFGGPSRE